MNACLYWTFASLQIHRHHLNLPWPLKDVAPVLSQKKVEILLDNFESESEDDVNPVFLKLKKHSNRTCDSVVDLAQLLEKHENKNEWKSVNLSVYTFQVIIN